MKFSSSVAAAALAGIAAAAPTASEGELPTRTTLEKRATTICGQWDTVETGAYTVYQDLWGEDNASSGSQCTTVDSDAIAWSTSWTCKPSPPHLSPTCSLGYILTTNRGRRII